jgi:superfamily II DNA or RNA helicase
MTDTTNSDSSSAQLENLRPYQINGINEIFEKWKQGKRSILFQMPTGTGKTVLFAEIARRGFVKNRKILIVVHRKELVEQIKSKLINKQVEVGIIMAGIKEESDKIVQVASIQTLSNREHAEPNLIIIDECHHAKAETYKTLWSLHPNAKILGVTATPIRMSGEGFDDIFDELITTMPVQKFIDAGYLVPITHYVCSNPNLSEVKQSQGDYVTKMLSTVMMDNSVMTDLIDSYLEKCNGKSMIVFAVDVEHSKEIALRYNKAGISAAHIDAKTPDQERQKILSDFKNKIIKVISNVEIITEGFDFPECEVVQLARPTKSLVLYLQMVGRVMRPAENKNEGIVLDNASLWLEHGISTIDRTWNLKGVKKRQKEDSELSIIALDKDGFIRQIERKKLSEVKGLKLIALNAEFERLFIFEELLRFSKSKEFNLLKAYNDYKNYLTDKKIKLSELEFKYIQNRLNFLNKKMPLNKRFNKAYWYHQSVELGLKKPKYEQ